MAKRLALLACVTLFLFVASAEARTFISPHDRKEREPEQQKKEAEEKKEHLSTDYWVEPMRQVHAKFTGEKGTFAHFGDSITDTRAFWCGLQWKRDNMDAATIQAWELAKGYMKKECFDWKGPKYGNQSAQKASWARQHIDTWLKNLDPECALIMFGTNDLANVPPHTYKKEMAEVIQKCLDNGTVVILSTIPPCHDRDEKVKVFVKIEHDLAKEKQVPLVDFHAEVIKWRPDDWDGALEKFNGYKGYDVPTLISRDGVHPSNPKQWNGDYSEEGLKHNGFTLRNYIVLHKYVEVIRKVFAAGKLGQEQGIRTHSPESVEGDVSVGIVRANGERRNRITRRGVSPRCRIPSLGETRPQGRR